MNKTPSSSPSTPHSPALADRHDTAESLAQEQPSPASFPEKANAHPSDAEGNDSASLIDASGPDSNPVLLPLLGAAPLRQHTRRLSGAFAGGVALAVVGLLLGSWQAHERSLRYTHATDTLVQAQRLNVTATNGISGQTQAYKAIPDGTGALLQAIGQLEQSGLAGDSVGPVVQKGSEIQNIAWQVATGSRALEEREAAFANIESTTAHLSELASNLSAASGQSPIQSAARRLLASSESMHNAVAVLRLSNASNSAVQEALQQAFQSAGSALQQLREQTVAANQQSLSLIIEALGLHTALNASLQTIQSTVEPAQQAQDALHKLAHHTDQMLPTLAQLRDQSHAQLGWPWYGILLIALGIVLSAGSGWLMARAHILASRNKYAQAQTQQQAASTREQDAKRLNDANQAAILRLMNELLLIAEGDLTQEATVTEDITGAIADSINYTIEELRHLISSVQASASKVAETTGEVGTTSSKLLAASNEQLREILETGRSILDMAQRINHVSAQAQESSSVARQSRVAAESGMKAVQNTIGGMNAIRAQIQESSKRIKRLGESSQEIGEITELISDITEQTNVLALNAAIQAASAGEAGRGFSVVAEEVQRLAERSADATRQIAALVKTIQSDTQDAVSAMERCTAGVVEGASLSDRAGTALSEIDQVSRTLSKLVEQISDTALHEATLANQVAESIQHIFVVTEQTSEGTRSTTQQVQELSQVAEELHQSIARFKIA